MRAPTQKAVRVAVQLRACDRAIERCSRWVLSLGEDIAIEVTLCRVKYGF